ncbi:MAG: 50S ribosomal protein L17 [Sedimentisphaerales bacterium]|nr:50S ribosomal protein L17 [Sedimentisphaerales bacterium]
MRHQVSGRHLGRTSAHRKALRRNLAASLFEHGTISTTIEKAKFVRPFAEKLITLARKGSLHARRRAIALLQDRDICKQENGEPVKVGSVIKKLFDEIAPRFADRPGGYTRIIRLPLRRIGDNGKLAILQLVDEQLTTPAPAARERKPAVSEPAAPAAEQPETAALPGEEESEGTQEQAGQQEPIAADEEKPQAQDSDSDTNQEETKEQKE